MKEADGWLSRAGGGEFDCHGTQRTFGDDGMFCIRMRQLHRCMNSSKLTEIHIYNGFILVHVNFNKVGLK